MDSAADTPAVKAFAGHRMVVLAFLAKNCAIGLNLGAYGTLVGALGKQYDVPRTLSASGLAVMMLTLGLASPLAGWLIRRYPLRWIMICGALLAAAGYFMSAFAPNIYVFLLMFVVVGLGVTLLGILPSSALVCNWYSRDRGKALGIANMPLFIFLAPIMSAFLMEAVGLKWTLIAISGLFLLVCVCLFAVIDRPEDVGQQSWGADSRSAAETQNAAVASLTTRELLRSPLTYLLTIAIGCMGAEGLVFVSHIVPLAVDRGLEFQAAATLVSSYGLSCAGGALLFGWLFDRLGARNALRLQIASQIIPWTALIWVHDSYFVLLGLSAWIGICSGATATLFAAVASSWFGGRNVAPAMGLVYFLQVPLLFAAPPLVGYLFERTGDYDVPILVLVSTCASVLAILTFCRPRLMHDRTATV